MRALILLAISIVFLTAGCKSSGCAAYGNYERNRKLHPYIKKSEKNCRNPYMDFYTNKKYKRVRNYKKR